MSHSSFPDAVGNVVVEGLNALYQEDLDRYLQGENVREDVLQRSWRDTTQVFASPVMLTACEQFINEIRKVNLRLPLRRRIRVIAADPPINWAMVQSREQFLPYLRNRVDFAAGVIEREVLQKRRKALLIFGLGQVMRNQQAKTPDGFVPLEPTLASLIDSRYPNRLYVAVPCRNPADPSVLTLEKYARGSRLPALIRMTNTSAGTLDPNEYLPPHSSILMGAPAPPFHMFRDGLQLRAIVDACVYKGLLPDHLLTPDPKYSSDHVYSDELERRAEIAEPRRR